MPRTVQLAAMVVVVAVVAAGAGCARQSTAYEKAERTQYVDAITAAMGERDQNQFSRDENRCIATSYVDVIGVSRLRDKVTPAQIRERPDNRLSDWGVRLNERNATALFERIDGCADFRTAFVADFLAGFPASGAEAQTECLDRNLDDAVYKDLAVTTLVEGDRFTLDPDQAGAVYRWAVTCIDMKAALLSMFTDRAGVPAAIVTCMGPRVNDDLLERFWTAALAAGSTGDISNDEAAVEMQGIMDACALEAGLVPGANS